MMKDISKAAVLSQIYTNHSVQATTITLCSDAQISSLILPSQNEYIRSPQRRENQALQQEVLSIRMSSARKQFKPMITGWIVFQSTRATPNVGCFCSKLANYKAIPVATATEILTISNPWKLRHFQLLPNFKTLMIS